MAKKRKKQKEEEEEKYEFVPPQFDERQFLLDEMRSTKRIFVLVAFAIVLGIVAGIVSEAIQFSLLGVLIFFLGIGSIKMLFTKAGFDLSKFTKRVWAESLFMYFLMFLAMWVIVINVPFSDHVPPEISDVGIVVDVGGISVRYSYALNPVTNTYSWVSNNSTSSDVTLALKGAYASGSSVMILARIADDTGLESVPFITFKPGLNEIPKSMISTGNYTYVYTIDVFDSSVLLGQDFTFRLSATDIKQNSASFQPVESTWIQVID